MATNHVVYTNDYLLSIESIVRAGRRLRYTLDADRATVEYATTRLERAAKQHETGATGYRAFMFSELETAAESDKMLQERATEDVLASVLADLQVANVLVAAGRSLGETGEKIEPRLLDEALFRLETTVPVIDRTLASPLAEGTESRRLGFAGEVAAPQVIQSTDLPSAIETFRYRSNETLVTLVKEAQGAVTGAITVLSQLDSNKVFTALSTLGDQMQELPKVGRLFRWGVEKLEEGIDVLTRLLGSEALNSVKTRVEKVWQDAKEGKYLTQILEWAFGVEATRTYIEETLCSEGLQREALDKASNSLVQLGSTFTENMAMVRGLTSALTLASLLTLTPLAGPNLALLIASADVLILAAVVLIGMDYADSGRILRRVRGVGEIAGSLRPGQF